MQLDNFLQPLDSLTSTRKALDNFEYAEELLVYD